ncbi:MAG: tail fiber domain-containing protein [Bacteroidales bacterium]|nr:tail fiber domain-containing protein [Bacteroidales bacterium]
MKKNYEKKLLLIFVLLYSCTFAYSQLKVSSTGNVGIATSNPSYKLDVEGTMRFSAWADLIVNWNGPYSAPQLLPERSWYFFIGNSTRKIGHFFVYNIDYENLYKVSDLRAKENIDTLKGVLSKINQINSFSYDYKNEVYENIPEAVKAKNKQKKQFGFAAQELETIFPELVYKPDTGMMKVDYVSMIPILTEAIKEQQTQISKLQNMVFWQENSIIELSEKINKLEKKNCNDSDKLKSTAIATETNTDQSIAHSALMQNIPNPFTEDTEISFVLDENSISAKLLIHDLQGAEIKQYMISERGKSTITLDGSELKPGMYLYTLIADDKIVDSKRMILTATK